MVSLNHGFHHHRCSFSAFRKLSKTVVSRLGPNLSGGYKPWWIWKNFMVVDVKVLGVAAGNHQLLGVETHHQLLGVDITNFLGLKHTNFGSWNTIDIFFRVETPIEWEAVSSFGGGGIKGVASVVWKLLFKGWFHIMSPLTWWSGILVKGD